MIRIVLVLASLGFAAGNDSLRIAQLEWQLQVIEAAKAQDQRNQDLARVAAMEADIRQLASAQSSMDGKIIWSAGDRIQNSIWLSIAGSGCLLLGQLGASNNSPGLAVFGLLGGFAFEIASVSALFKAGEDFKKASGQSDPARPAAGKPVVRSRIITAH